MHLAASRLHLGGPEVDALQHGGEVAVLAHAAVLAHRAPVVHGPALVRAEEPAQPEHLARAQEAVAHLARVLISGHIARVLRQPWHTWRGGGVITQRTHSQGCSGSRGTPGTGVNQRTYI